MNFSSGDAAAQRKLRNNAHRDPAPLGGTAKAEFCQPDVTNRRKPDTVDPVMENDMSLEALTKEVADLKRRLEIAETKLSQQAGQFEFITGQLRDVQLYMHARFDDADKRFDDADKRFDGIDRQLAALKSEMNAKFAAMDAKIDALPRVMAEVLAELLAKK